ncbi:hypothetical protein GCM10010103_16350 [Streptomyces paradoxus]|nr:hypothetical protein [Streptomyces paradoxus]
MTDAMAVRVFSGATDGPAPGRAPASPGTPGSRPPEFDREVHERRTTVERCVNRLKQRRGIATRYEKAATIHLAGLHISGVSLRSAR